MLPTPVEGCGGVAASVLHHTQHLLLNNTSMVSSVINIKDCLFKFLQYDDVKTREVKKSHCIYGKTIGIQ